MKTEPTALHRAVRKFGIGRTCVGYRYLICALELVLADPSRLELVTKCLYPEVARRFAVTPGGVDKALRTAAGRAGAASVTELLAALYRTVNESQLPL